MLRSNSGLLAKPAGRFLRNAGSLIQAAVTASTLRFGPCFYHHAKRDVKRDIIRGTGVMHHPARAVIKIASVQVEFLDGRDFRVFFGIEFFPKQRQFNGHIVKPPVV